MRLIDADMIEEVYALNAHEVGRYVKQILDSAKTVDAVPVKHGKWIPDKTGNSYWICTKCGFPSEASGAFALYHYCPNCGARMDV